MIDADTRRNILWRQVSAVLQVLTVTGAFTVLAHTVPQESVGRLSYFTSIIQIVYMLSCTSGIVPVAIGDATQGKPPRFVISNVVILLSVINTVVVISLLLLACGNFAALEYSSFAACALVLIAVVPSSFQIELARTERMDAVAKIEIANSLVYFTCISMACILWPEFHVLVFAAVMSQIFIGIYYLHFGLRRHLFSFAERSIPYLRQLFAEAFPIVAYFVLGAFLNRMAVFMLEPWMGSVAVAKYSAAETIAGCLSFFVIMTSSSVYPALCSAAAEDRDRLKALYKHTVYICFARILPIATIMSIAPEFILVKLYGPEYLDAGSTLIVLIGAGIFGWFNTPGIMLLTALRKQRIYLWTTMLALVVDVFLNVLLVPSRGIFGAALGYLCAEFLLCASNLYFIYREIRFIPYLAEK